MARKTQMLDNRKAVGHYLGMTKGVWKFIGYSVSVVGAAIMFMASVGPDEAASKISAWASRLNLHSIATWLSSEQADLWALRYGALLLISAFFIWVLSRDKKLKESSAPTADSSETKKKKSTTEKPSVFTFIKAKGDLRGLILKDNLVIGSGTFVDVEGKIENSKIEGNVHLEVEKRAGVRFPHNIWVLEAIYYMVYGKWGVSDLQKEKLEQLEQAKKDFEQSAYDGQVPVWGRQGFSSVFQKIPNNYWKDWQLSWTDILKGDPEQLGTNPTSLGGRHYVGVSSLGALKTNKETIEKLWPSKNK